MRNVLILLLLLVSFSSFSQKWQTIRGNGELKKETREVGSYSSLLSQGSINVQIEYGSANTLTIEADENLLPYLETVVEDGNLIIRSKRNVNLRSTSKMIAHVSMTKIKSLQLSGSGNINGNGAFSNDGKTDIGISGSGNVTLGFNAFDELDLAIAGSGNMDLQSNKTGKIKAAISGSGNIDCSSISCSDVDARISGSGNIKVNASHSIDAKISGSGNVMYKGAAQDITSKTAGSGKVLKM